MVLIPFNEVLNIQSPNARCIHSKSALGALRSGDTVILNAASDGLTRIGLIRGNMKRFDQIPASQQPIVPPPKKSENIKDNGGYYIFLQWMYVAHEYPEMLAALRRHLASSNHPSQNCPSLKSIPNQEVLISNHADWMPFVDVVDVAECHDWRDLSGSLRDIRARAQSFWCRFLVDVKKKIQRSEMVSIPAGQWSCFSEDRYEQYSDSGESLPYRRFQIVEIISFTLLSILKRSGERSSNRASKTMPFLANDFAYVARRLSDYGLAVVVFRGVRKEEVVRDMVVEAIRRRCLVSMVRIADEADLDAAAAFFGDRIRHHPRQRPSVQPRPRPSRGEDTTPVARESLNANITNNEFVFPAAVDEARRVRRRYADNGFDFVYDPVRRSLTISVRFSRCDAAPVNDGPLPLQYAHQDHPPHNVLPQVGLVQEDADPLALRDGHIHVGAQFPAELEEGNRELIKIASINGDECLVRVLYSTVPERIDKEVRVERAILEAMLGRHLHGLPGVI